MKKTIVITSMILLGGLTLISCSQESQIADGLEGNTGYLSLNLNTENIFSINSSPASSRSVQESSYSNVDNYTVVVLDKDGIEKLNCKGSEVASNMPIAMPIGSCEVQAYYGTESAASRDAFYVYGKSIGTIKADQNVSLSVACSPTCGRVSVAFSPEMSTYYTDYKVSFSGTQALSDNTVEWLKEDTEPWYIQLANTGETVSFTLTVTTKDEYINADNKEKVTSKSGTFTLKRNKAYKLKISPVYTASGTGDLTLDINIDASTIDKECDIEVPVDWL